ncbi:24805_t:CDS:2, partial [Cetraspora pellucida]
INSESWFAGDGVTDWYISEGRGFRLVHDIDQYDKDAVLAIKSSLVMKFLRTNNSILAKSLYKNTTLTYLDLSHNFLQNEGCKALAEALNENTKLTHLHLQNNYIGPEGGIVIALALQKNISLTHLNLSENKLGPDGGQALANALCKNKSLKHLLLWNNQLSFELEKARSKNNIVHLGISNNNTNYVTSYVAP